MKKLLALLVMTTTAGTTVMAANPFVDVRADSWAYNSVVELANSGIVQGVDGIHFQGERNITRYEAAEMVAKAMAHEDRANAEQRALINRLADEFSDELNNLGVRVSHLEDRVGKVKMTGDARIRYMNAKNSPIYKQFWDFRGRLRDHGQINDRTEAVLGVQYDNNFDDETAASGSPSVFTYGYKLNNFFVDTAYVNYALDPAHKWNLKAGRYTYVLGKASGLQYDDPFDGAELSFTNKKFTATAGYGKFKDGYSNNAKTAYGELEGNFGGGSMTGSAAGIYYNNYPGMGGILMHAPQDLKGAYVSLNFGPRWNLFGEYNRVSFKDDTASADVYYGKLQYGKALFEKPKTWDLWVDYLNSGSSGIQDFLGTGNWRTEHFTGGTFGVTSWGVGGDYVFAKNAKLQLFRAFASEIRDCNHCDAGNFTRAQLVFVF